MISKEILEKIRRLEIKTRQMVQSTFSGEYHSTFKGQGVSFSEVRPYQFGDDVRLIDWKVSTKMQTPYIKRFEEERDLTVMILMDVSGSSYFGSSDQIKKDIGAEIAAVLGFSAVYNNDKVGLMLFSDQVEVHVPPKKGKDHMFRLLRDIYYHQPTARQTSLSEALFTLNKVQKKKAIVFVISDFIDPYYERTFQIAAKRHDVVPIILEDERELDIPDVGLLSLEDQETGYQRVVDTSTQNFQQSFKTMALARQLDQERFFKSLSITPLRIHTGQPYFSLMNSYFKQRMKHQ